MKKVEDLSSSSIEVVKDLSFEVIKGLDSIEVVEIVKGLSFEVIKDLDLIEAIEVVKDLSFEVVEDLNSIKAILKASLEALIPDFIDLL